MKLTAESSSFTSAMQNAKRNAKEFGDESEKAADKAEKAFSNLKSAIIGLGIGQALKTSITDAMNAVESESLFEVSLGKYANQARAWSEEMSNALGLDGYALRKNLGTLYNMTTSMGLTKDKAYELSTGLTALAEDMASFYNLSSEEAFAKLRSGITGEAEPLKAIGILLNETAVEQAAYRHGIAETGTALTDQQKVLARYAAILDQTANAQGDLARTMDSPSNQLRATMNDLKQASIEFGMALMPIVQTALPILRGIIEDIKPVAIDVATGVSYLSSALSALESPAVRTIAYAAAVIGVMNKLKVAVGGPLTAVILLGTALAWLAGKFGEVEGHAANDITELADESKKATDEAQKGAEDLGKEYDKTGGKIKSMLAGFDEITKLSGGSSSLISTSDVQNAEDINKELTDANGIINDIENRINDIFGKNYSMDASISEIGLPEVDWDVVIDNFKEWVEKQDWNKAWQDVGEAFVSVFEMAFALVDGIFGTKLGEWYGQVVDEAYKWGFELERAVNPNDEGLLALEKYQQEHGRSAWSDFYEKVQNGEDIREAFKEVYNDTNLKKGFLASDARLATFHIEELKGMSKEELAKYLTPSDERRAGDLISQTYLSENPNLIGLFETLWYDSTQNKLNTPGTTAYSASEIFSKRNDLSPVPHRPPHVGYSDAVDTSSVMTPATAEDMLSIMQGVVGFGGTSSINIKVESIMDGEKVGEGVATYNDNQIVNTNGR